MAWHLNYNNYLPHHVIDSSKMKNYKIKTVLLPKEPKACANKAGIDFMA